MATFPFRSTGVHPSSTGFLAMGGQSDDRQESCQWGRLGPDVTPGAPRRRSRLAKEGEGAVAETAPRPTGRGTKAAPSLLYLVKRTELAVRARLDEVLKPSGLTALQYTALTVLERHDGLT